MTIKEIVDNSLMGLKFSLNENFKLEESFDPGTIFYIHSVFYFTDGCFEVNISIDPEDFDYNFSIAKVNWYNFDGVKSDLINIYQSLYKGYYQSTQDGYRLIKPLLAKIYVMEDDDCFDLDLQYLRNNRLNELLISMKDGNEKNILY
jgi:hypothetical protein